MAYGLRGRNLRFPRFPHDIDMDSFKRFLDRNHSPKTSKDILYYAKIYGSCLLEQDFSKLNNFSISKKRHALAALSNLAKFLGIHEDFKKLVKDYGLKWENVKAEDLLISRLTKFETQGSVIAWTKKVKEEWPCFGAFMDFITVSGLRCVEAIESCNLIIDLSRQGKLNEYYNAEKEVLEHFRFKQIFIRNNKKAFVSIVPRTLIERVALSEKITLAQITNRIKRKGLNPRFNDIREYYATCMTRHLSQPEIDFLQGRISGSVFMRNYFNPALISDLKERVFKAIEELSLLS